MNEPWRIDEFLKREGDEVQRMYGPVYEWPCCGEIDQAPDFCPNCGQSIQAAVRIAGPTRAGQVPDPRSQAVARAIARQT